MIVADERGDFGEIFPVSHLAAAPVAGTQGLVAAIGTPAPSKCSQNRLPRLRQAADGRRRITGWAAVRSVARPPRATQSGDAKVLRRLYPQPEFELAAFWPQPELSRLERRIAPADADCPARALVSLSPQKRVLHPSSDLDTLGFDAPEVKCKA